VRLETLQIADSGRLMAGSARVRHVETLRTERDGPRERLPRGARFLRGTARQPPAFIMNRSDKHRSPRREHTAAEDVRQAHGVAADAKSHQAGEQPDPWLP